MIVFFIQVEIFQVLGITSAFWLELGHLDMMLWDWILLNLLFELVPWYHSGRRTEGTALLLPRGSTPRFPIWPPLTWRRGRTPCGWWPGWQFWGASLLSSHGLYWHQRSGCVVPHNCLAWIKVPAPCSAFSDIVPSGKLGYPATQPGEGGKRGSPTCMGRDSATVFLGCLAEVQQLLTKRFLSSWPFG